MGYVYGIQSDHLIKVGAADDIRRRLHTFQLYNPHPVKIVLRRFVKENYWLEKRMHKLLAQYAVGREWFDCSPEHVRDAFETSLKELIARRHQIVGTPKGWKDDSRAVAQLFNVFV
jgi:hypothetical protein